MYWLQMLRGWTPRKDPNACYTLVIRCTVFLLLVYCQSIAICPLKWKITYQQFIHGSTLFRSCALSSSVCVIFCSKDRQGWRTQVTSSQATSAVHDGDVALNIQHLPWPWLFWISQKPNLIIVLLYIERKKKWKSCFCFFTDGLTARNTAQELDMITLRNLAPQSYKTW